MNRYPIFRLACALLLSVALVGCGDDDSDTPDTASTPTVSPAPTATAEASATPDEQPADNGKGNKGNGNNGTPQPTKTVPPIPSSTPEPGPPVRFGAVISGGGIEPTVDEIEAGKSLVVSLESTIKKPIEVQLVANGLPVGAAAIAPPELKIDVLVRNLEPGKLVFKSGKKRATVRVVE